MSKIAHYRKLARLTQEELAERADLGTGATVSNYEALRRQPGIHELRRIRDVFRACGLELELDDLIDDQPDSQPAA